MSDQERLGESHPTQDAPLYTLDPSVDGFAQTRAPDDLFDDDFTPIAYSEPVPDPTPVVPEPQPAQLPREPPRGPRGRGGKRGGGRSSPPKAEPAVEAEGTEAAEVVEAAETPKPERKEGAVRGDRSGTGGIKKVGYRAPNPKIVAP